MNNLFYKAIKIILTRNSHLLPKHVAFIMDGNRRFARQRNIDTFNGHEMGFHALEQILEHCLELGIKIVTIYAFSIDNFKRSKAEVNSLMELLKRKLKKLSQESDLVMNYGVKVKFIGDISLLPLDVLEEAKHIMEMSKQNSSAILNICCPYSSRFELDKVIRKATTFEEFIELSLDISEASSYPLDMLIRTSGETRLSDFMLWEGLNDSQIYFVDKLWPQFNVWDMLRIFLNHSTWKLMEEFNKRS